MSTSEQRIYLTYYLMYYFQQQLLKIQVLRGPPHLVPEVRVLYDSQALGCVR